MSGYRIKRKRRAIITVPAVSDHAVLRYLERAKGYDLDGVRKHIADVCRIAVDVGACCLKAEGVEFIFENRTVVTVVRPGAP